MIINVGEDIIFNINLNNPDQVLVSGVVINEVVYNSLVSNNDKSVITINIGEATLEGLLDIDISTLDLLIDENITSITLDYSSTLEVFKENSSVDADATIEIVKVESSSDIVDITGDTKVTYSVYLQNKDALDYTNIHIGANNLTYLDIIMYSPTHFSFSLDAVEGKNIIELEEIDFIRNGESIKVSQDYSNKEFVYGYDPVDIIYLDSSDDFSQISSNPSGLYVLANDIDMAGTFPGLYNITELFYGNGFKLSNVTMTNNIPDVTSSFSPNFGFVSNNYGFIMDVTFEDFNYTINNEYIDNQVNLGLIGNNEGVIKGINIIGDSSVTTNGFKVVHVGGLVGNNDGVITRSSTDINIDINSINTIYYLNETSIGGLVGSLNGGYVELSSTISDIDLAVNSASVGYYIGGLIGDMDNGTVINSYAKTNILSNEDSIAGGLVGYANANNNAVYYSYASGNISAYGYTGGLVGDIAQPTKVYNSFTDVNVYNLDYSYDGSLGIISIGNYVSEMINNCYYNENQIFSFNSVIVNNPNGYDYYLLHSTTNEEFNSEDFYMDNMFFNEYLYDFSNLDSIDNQYPVHK
ncbi:hypothetical protein CI105_08085 [Candidatus Izimaplasma bacterium ZiA1]|uniref:hypothetical protein n=1 Tax=Candidatus Izimoplasma sp. ZiA1 TaxID=2024899 RepID=UPI000BAA75EC|nr:hypothetical protein CI105_08085 [Candidatus Izimaplasma bacterium ZiA1]